MPFTPAHTMAVLPLVRWRKRLLLDPTCLVIGSMAPDFEYFVRARLKGGVGHSMLGIALWCIPVTIALAVTYHHLVKWTVLMALPARISRRAVSVMGRDWPSREWPVARTLGSLAVSAALGAMTHLAWDGVTHPDGWTVERVAVLRTIHDMPWGRVPLHRVIQHASSVLGLTVVGYVIYRALRHAPERAVPSAARLRTWLIFAACMMAIVAVAFMRLRRINHFDAAEIVVASISGMLGAAILTSLIVRAQTVRFRDAVRPG
ncbi:MAG: DUF4184 family protein [Deltaproteobacteria bacterium]|nr:DUF4184 family protein [Deltaproteobacteria bacterium]